MMAVLYNLFESIVLVMGRFKVVIHCPQLFSYQENERIKFLLHSTSNSGWTSVNHTLLTYFLNGKQHQTEESKRQNEASDRTKQATERSKTTKQATE